MEQGDGEEERGEDVGIGFGRGVDESVRGWVPVVGGVEEGGGEEEREGVIGTGLGRGGWERIGVEEEGVGAGDGMAEERGVCFGGEEDVKEAAEGMCAGGVAGMEAV